MLTKIQQSVLPKRDGQQWHHEKDAQAKVQVEGHLSARKNILTPMFKATKTGWEVTLLQHPLGKW